MAYWVARTEYSRTQVALRYLALKNFETYYPLTAERRVRQGRRVVVQVPLFVNYIFIRAGLQWSGVRWCIGVADLLMNNGHPAQVSDALVAEIRGRERNGIVQLPQRPPPRPGDPVVIVHGPLRGLMGLHAGLRGHERVAILLAALGHVVLARDAIEPV
jgi:transcription antitermination factor NusG